MKRGPFKILAGRDRKRAKPMKRSAMPPPKHPMTRSRPIRTVSTKRALELAEAMESRRAYLADHRKIRIIADAVIERRRALLEELGRL